MDETDQLVEVKWQYCHFGRIKFYLHSAFSSSSCSHFGSLVLCVCIEWRNWNLTASRLLLLVLLTELKSDWSFAAITLPAISLYTIPEQKEFRQKSLACYTSSAMYILMIALPTGTPLIWRKNSSLIVSLDTSLNCSRIIMSVLNRSGCTIFALPEYDANAPIVSFCSEAIFDDSCTRSLGRPPSARHVSKLHRIIVCKYSHSRSSTAMCANLKRIPWSICASLRICEYLSLGIRALSINL